MRISDWSSDVCSSDLARQARGRFLQVDARCDPSLRARSQTQTAQTNRSHLREVAARVDEHRPRRAESEVRPRWPHPHMLQPAAYLYLSAIARRCGHRSEEHTSELQSLMRISYAVFC